MDTPQYDTEKIIATLETGSFRNVYQLMSTVSPNAIINQLKQTVSWLNSIVIPCWNLEMNHFEKKEKKLIRRLMRELGVSAALILERTTLNKQFYTIKCCRCEEEVRVSFQENCWQNIQNHEHFEEMLSNPNFDTSRLTVDVPTVSGTTCSCLVTLPTNFKFSFNVGYFQEVVRLFYVNEKFENDWVNIDGTCCYMLKIIDDDKCSCFLCKIMVDRKTVRSHILGKQHLKNKRSPAHISEVLNFHRQWITQELAFQCHQVYFVPFPFHYALCQLCTASSSASYVRYEDLRAHILESRHRVVVLELFRIYPNVVSLKMQMEVYRKEDTLIALDDEQMENQTVCTDALSYVEVHREDEALITLNDDENNVQLVSSGSITRVGLDRKEDTLITLNDELTTVQMVSPCLTPDIGLDVREDTLITLNDQQTDAYVISTNSRSDIVNGDSLSHVQQITCNNCSSFTPQPLMHFNFNITYHPNIETLLYGDNLFSSSKIELNNGVKLHSIMCKSVNQCVCLLCQRKFNVSDADGHLQGLKHIKRVTDSKCVAHLFAFHRYWIAQEQEYQAHQVYFLPSSPNSAKCTLCDYLIIFYDLIHNHLKDDRHKNGLRKWRNLAPQLRTLQYKLYQCEVNSNSTSMINNIDLEQSAYEPKDMLDITSNINSLEKMSTDQPSTSGTITMNRNSSIKSESQSDDEQSDQETDQVHPTQMKVKPDTNKEKPVHQIVTSLEPDSHNVIHKLMERRYWSDFERGMKIYENHVECLVCKETLDKQHDILLRHCCSSSHKANIGNTKKYKFYCEICDFHVSREESWLNHLVADKHKARYEKMGNRQNKLMEYECIPCHLIIFGDLVSLTRHRLVTIEKKKRTKNLTLHQNVKNLFVNEKRIMQEANKLVNEAREVLQNRRVIDECCRGFREALMELYPCCTVHPFGSQVSGLGNLRSDLDLFVDLDDMYFGNKNQDSRSQEKFVSDVMKIFIKKPRLFSDLNPIASARTPIVQVVHIPTKLDCDLSFRHGLSVENTKYLRCCIEIQPSIQQLILLLKRWLQYNKLSGHITTYSLSMMAIFFYQSLEYLMPVRKLMQSSQSVKWLVIDGWAVIDFDTVDTNVLREHSKSCVKTLKQLLVEFFQYYTDFNYERDVICPLLGYPIAKSLFNAQGVNLPIEMLTYVKKITLNATDHFRADCAICIQDPFDLSHNLTKGCSSHILNKFKKLCSLTHTFLMTGK